MDIIGQAPKQQHPQLNIHIPPNFFDAYDDNDDGMEGDADGSYSDQPAGVGHELTGVGGYIAGMPAGVDNGQLMGMPDLSDLENSYDSTYHPGSDVSTCIESYN